MAEQKTENHPEAPSLSAMAGFALFLAIGLLSLVLFLHFKFGTPGAV